MSYVANADAAGGSSGYSFKIDSTKIEEAVKRLNDDAKTLEGYIEDIYSELNGLNECWSGASYETFIEKCNVYRPALDTLVSIVRAYSLLLNNDVTKAMTDLDSKLNSLFSKIGG